MKYNFPFKLIVNFHFSILATLVINKIEIVIVKMDLNSALEEIRKLETEDKQKNNEVLNIYNKIDDIEKATNAVEEGNVDLEKQIVEAEKERSKLRIENELQTKLLEYARTKVKEQLTRVSVAEKKTEETQDSVVTELRNLIEGIETDWIETSIPETPVPEITEDAVVEEKLRKDIIRLKAEVEAMEEFSAFQKEKIEEIKLIKQNFEQNRIVDYY